MRPWRNSQWWNWAGAAFLAVGLVASADAQDPDDLQRGVARVSLLNGEVSVQRGDSGDWVAASLNSPVVTGDRVSTGAGSRTELQFDSANILRIGADSDVSVTQLESGRYQMAVAHGTVTFRVLRQSSVDIEIDTPSVSVRPSEEGAYRISVDDSGQTSVTARSGEVEVFTPRGSQWVHSGQILMARGDPSDPEFQVVAASFGDDWDRWNDSRDALIANSVSYRYVGPGVYGAEDLDAYGTWVDVPGYGDVWRPLVVADWAPYRQGRWVWEDWYGWTWVSYEPWGWAPYHYGRWFYEPAYGWCWYPGAIGVRHYWAPGLVAFFGFGGGGGIGFAYGNVGWVPLAPYEVLHPWWGRPYYGGPGYVNRSVNITNISVTNVYRNARVNNGVTAVSNNDFQAGRFQNFVRVNGNQMQNAGIVRGQMPLAPSQSNLRFSDRQTAFVPRSPANPRFFMKQQPKPAPSVSFAQQRRTFDQASGNTRGRFGEVDAAGVGPRTEPPPAPARTEAPAWQRFGGSRTIQPAAPPANTGSRFGATAGGNRSEPPQPRSEAGSRQSFAGNGAEPRVTPPSRPQALPVAPPVVRERSSPPPSFSAPRSGGESRPPSGGGGSRGNSGGNSGGSSRSSSGGSGSGHR